MRTMTRTEVRAFDRRAIEELGVPGIVLMENAGRQAADEAVRLLAKSGGRHALVVAGRGNNGGDGFVVARHLVARGYTAEVLLLGDPNGLQGDAATNFRCLSGLRITVREAEASATAVSKQIMRLAAGADLIVDALLGTGLTGEVREPHLAAIEAMNASRKAILAIDIPSGLDADTGRPLGTAVRAVSTVTFVAAKVGFAAAPDYVGHIVVADIGVPIDF